MNAIATLQTSGLAAVSLREYRAYSPERASVSSPSAAAARGVKTGIQFAAAGTISRMPQAISSTPMARHPPCESARICFASSSNFNALYAPPDRQSRASAAWAIHKRMFIVFSLSSFSCVSIELFVGLHPREGTGRAERRQPGIHLLKRLGFQSVETTLAVHGALHKTQNAQHL